MVTEFRNKLCNKRYCHKVADKLNSNEKGRYTEIVKQPGYIRNGKLHDHQLTGLNWLAYSWHNENNVILADEMGLGKTVQTIAFFNYLIHRGFTRPFLVVAPLSTLPNWERELNKWLPEFVVINFHGNKVSRDVMKSNEFFFGAPILKSITRFNVVLTSYEMLWVENKFLSKINWRVIVIDEGNKLKNQKSKIFNWAVGMTSEFRILLSGTPLQNNIDELLNLLHFISPKKFNQNVNDELKKKFYESWEESALLPDNSEESKSNNEDVPPVICEPNENVTSIQLMLQPHLLRRLKVDALENFPLKKEIIIPIELTERQRKIYKWIFKKNFDALSYLDKKENNKNKVSLKSANNVLLYLRLCCNHPLLLSHKYNKKLKPYENFEFEADKIHKKTDKQIIDEFDNELVESSGKMRLFDKLVPKLLEEKRRILIFSQFKLMLNILEEYFYLKSIPYLRLDGETPADIRQSLIDEFNKENSQFQIFLLSTRAGGLGINLTKADTVIIFDSDFNPHNDLQALSRAHRIGQKNNLVIYRLVCINTWEQKMVEVASEKLKLSHLMTNSKPQLDSSANDTDVIELNKILKFGTDKILSEEEIPEAGYSDELLEGLMNRENIFKSSSKEHEQEPSSDFFNLFKEAKISEEPDAEWEQIIGREMEEIKTQELLFMGKGMRNRNKINYNTEVFEITSGRESDYEVGSESLGAKGEDEGEDSRVDINGDLQALDDSKNMFKVLRMSKHQRHMVLMKESLKYKANVSPEKSPKGSIIIDGTCL